MTRFILIIFMFLIPLFSFADSKNKGWVTGIYFTPGSDCQDQIINKIQNSKTIRAAVYSVNNDDIINALITAKSHGADIVILTDKLQSKSKYSGIPKLKAAGIPVFTNTGFKLEHNKFAVFDNNNVVTGSYNWTNPATDKNSENCIFITDADQKYAERFQALRNKYAYKKQ